MRALDARRLPLALSLEKWGVALQRRRAPSSCLRARKAVQLPRPCPDWSLGGIYISFANGVQCLQRRRSFSARALHVFVVAGEPSGDALGAAVMAAMRTHLAVEARAERGRSKQAADGVRFSGIGGPLMRKAGLEVVFDMADLSVMGLSELIPHLPRLYARLQQARRAVAETKPDILLTIDSKGFNFRLLRSLAALEPKPPWTTVHYVAPSVWAYKGDHSKTKAFLGSAVDLLLVLFPFEQSLFCKHVQTGRSRCGIRILASNGACSRICRGPEEHLN